MQEFPSFGFTDRTAKQVAVILAGGEGSRLRSLTRVIVGDERPKQFCPILEDRTLLDATRGRLAKHFSSDRIFFSLTEKHAKYYKRSLRNVAAYQKVVQPENLGTAPAILFSLMRIAKESPNASVTFFPSDHYFADDDSFMQNVAQSINTAEFSPNSIVLLGIQPDKAETSYGWIELAESLFGGIEGSVSRVKRFWEKPARETAKELFRTGCLWNSFVMTGRASAFLGIFERQLPEMYRLFAASADAFGTLQEPAVLRSIYSWISETNFSSEVLERSPDELLVMRVGDVGWSDWGEPTRVIGTLADLGINPDWMQAVAA